MSDTTVTINPDIKFKQLITYRQTVMVYDAALNANKYVKQKTLVGLSEDGVPYTYDEARRGWVSMPTRKLG